MYKQSYMYGLCWAIKEIVEGGSWLWNLHPTVLSLSLPLSFNGTGKENKIEKFMNQGKIRKFTYQLLSMEKPNLTWKKKV